MLKKLTIFFFFIIFLYILILILFVFFKFLLLVVVLFLGTVPEERYANFLVKELPNGAGIDFLHLTCVLFSLFPFSNLSDEIVME